MHRHSPVRGDRALEKEEGRRQAPDSGIGVVDQRGRHNARHAAQKAHNSNEAMRDEHIQTIGLQSATYPKATFTLSAPMKLPAGALGGKVFRAPVTGVFTIHGTARRLTVPLEMRLTSSSLQAVGSLTFPWSEFNMTAPSVGGFVSVTSTATMEFDLDLQRA